MTKTHNIQIESLPEGWRPVAYRCADKGEYRLQHGEILLCDGTGRLEYLIVEKIQPRRMVLEETEEESNCTQHMNIDGVKISINFGKIWREVKEGE